MVVLAFQQDVESIFHRLRTTNNVSALKHSNTRVQTQRHHHLVLQFLAFECPQVVTPLLVQFGGVQPGERFFFFQFVLQRA